MPTPQRRSRRRGMLIGAAVANSRSAKASTQQSSAPAPVPETAAPTDLVKQLTDLKGLLDNGILTQEEFDAKKKQILGL